MRAIQMERTGGPDVLAPVELPDPKPGPGQVLIRVAAAGVNFAETMMRAGTYPLQLPLPAVPGSEVAGTVAAVGQGTVGPAVGTRVVAPLFAAGALTGGYAEFVVADARVAFPIPDALPFERAVALPVQGMTAYYLLHHAAPPSGKSVLVLAAAGGVGSLLVQLARHLGAARVVAAAGSAAKLALAADLGADAGVDYTRPGWAVAVREATGGKGADIVLDSVGGEATAEALLALAPHGRLVAYGALSTATSALSTAQITQLIYQNQSVTGFALPTLLADDQARLGRAMADLIEAAAAGRLRVLTPDAFPLVRAADAHRAVEARRTTGKVVLSA